MRQGRSWHAPHVTGGDPHMRDESPAHGMAAVIPSLNRLAQAHEAYQEWLEPAMAKAEDEGRFVDFDEERADRLEDLYRSAAEVVETWVDARGRAPIGQ